MKEVKFFAVGILLFFSVLVVASCTGHQDGAQSADKWVGKSPPTADFSVLRDQESLSEPTNGKVHVQNIQGQVVGRVVAIAERSGELTYILIAKNDSAGELTPIPVSAALFDSRKNAIIVTVGDPELVEAPSLTPDELQKLDDPEFEERVHGYYERESRWEPNGQGLKPGSEKIAI